jgi:hypothetical protein
MDERTKKLVVVLIRRSLADDAGVSAQAYGYITELADILDIKEACLLHLVDAVNDRFCISEENLDRWINERAQTAVSS